MFDFKISRERKFILAAGAVVLLLGAIYRFSPAIGFFNADPKEVEIKAKTVEKYRQKAQQRHHLQARLINLTKRLERAERMLLTGATPALVAVDIQNLINDIVHAQGLAVESVRVLKPTDSPIEGYLEVPVSISIKLEIGQLINLLYKIETAPKLLTVTDMTLRRHRQRKTEMEQISAVFTVIGYMKNASLEPIANLTGSDGWTSERQRKIGGRG